MTETEQKLKKAGIENARFEAKEIDRAFCGAERKNAINRRIEGEPLQYILGEWEFYSLPFLVGEGVLIPRPDTETLCDIAIDFIKDKSLKCIDLCSGSGAVAIAVEKNCKNAKVFALEKSDKAFSYLEKNVALNNSSVTAIKGDLFEAPKEKFDVILSNPPYIPTADLRSLQREVQFEPEMALDGGEDGLLFYKGIIENWLPALNRGGLLAVECGIGQAEDIANLFRKVKLSDVTIKNDLCGVQRVIFGTLDNV